MDTRVDREAESTGSVLAETGRSGFAGAFQFADRRTDTAQLQAMSSLANRSARYAAVAQLQAAADGFVQQQQILQRAPNNTNLPDDLKSGIENLSGVAMNDVKVHYNSDKPAQLHAHAYAQGTDIHVALGQEQHLPHEAWHVVQQKQGRVQPTVQMKGDTPVNDDAGLEKEADIMGEKALQMASVADTAGQPVSYLQPNRSRAGTTVQAKLKYQEELGGTLVEQLNSSSAPDIFKTLFKQLNDSPKEITIALMSGGACANFDPGANTISFNAKAINDALAMEHEKEAGWEAQKAFVYATVSHEFRHAYDSNVAGISMLSGEMSEVGEVWGLYKTELNAWQSEARAYLEHPDSSTKAIKDNKLIQGWLSFDIGSEDQSNEIWDRIIRYTNGAFQGRFPEGWRGDTWGKKMRIKFMANDELKLHAVTLAQKFVQRYAEKFPD
jgi:hypothetical protein